MKIRRGIVAACVLLPIAGCLKFDDDLGAGLAQYGAVSVHGTAGAAGTANATASVIFFRAFSANTPNSRNQANTCQFSLVDTTTRVSPGTMRAGTQLSIAVGAAGSVTSATLPYNGTTLSYGTLGATNYKAGDSVTVSIPGEVGGFPAASIAVRLAEPLIAPDVVTPDRGFVMPIRWNASPDTSTAMIISLKYANPPTSTYANEQIICSLTDDGAEDLPGSALGFFLDSPAAMRSLKLTRWRTQIMKPTDSTFLHIVSYVDTLVKLK